MLARGAGALFHTDAAQAAGRIPLDVAASVITPLVALSVNSSSAEPEATGRGRSNNLRRATQPRSRIHLSP